MIKRLNINGVSLAYAEAGSGPETVVMSHSYLVDHRLFEAQIDALKDRYRVLAFDHRGHGSSDKPETGYDMESLYADAVAFIEKTDAAPCHYVGLSTGGFIGLRLGFRRPELLRSLVLMDTSADAEPTLNRVKYEGMFAVLRSLGFAPLVGAAMSIMFGPTFLHDSARRDEVGKWRERIMANDPRALVRFGHGIFSRESVVDQLAEIRVPTLVLVGENDVATPPFRAERIAEGIPDARLSFVPAAGHLSTIENPDFVSAALLSFFADGSVDEKVATARTPRSMRYDGAPYGRIVDPLITGVHSFVTDHLPEGERVLDACCGTGGLSRRLARSGRDVLGVDLSPRNITYAERQGGDSANPRFELGDVSRLDHYEDSSFDVATLVMALHEMPHACRAPILHELMRVARTVMVVDFEAPMPWNFAGVRNRAIEAIAGGEHFRAFRDFSRRGGLRSLVEKAKVRVVSERVIDGGTLRVQQLTL